MKRIVIMFLVLCCTFPNKTWPAKYENRKNKTASLYFAITHFNSTRDLHWIAKPFSNPVCIN